MHIICCFQHICTSVHFLKPQVHGSILSLIKIRKVQHSAAGVVEWNYMKACPLNADISHIYPACEACHFLVLQSSIICPHAWELEYLVILDLLTLPSSMQHYWIIYEQCTMNWHSSLRIFPQLSPYMHQQVLDYCWLEQIDLCVL